MIDLEKYFKITESMKIKLNLLHFYLKTILN